MRLPRWVPWQIPRWVPWQIRTGAPTPALPAAPELGLRSIRVRTSDEGVSSVEIDGHQVVNITKIVVDATKPYIEARIDFIPESWLFAIEKGVVLVCEDCGGHLTQGPNTRDLPRVGVTDDRNDPHLGHGSDDTPVPQNDKYLVLSDAERAKEFVRPLRTAYRHLPCGTTTTMGPAIAKTYAREPSFYGATYCMACSMHRPVGEHGEFTWLDGTKVGT